MDLVNVSGLYKRRSVASKSFAYRTIFFMKTRIRWNVMKSGKTSKLGLAKQAKLVCS